MTTGKAWSRITGLAAALVLSLMPALVSAQDLEVKELGDGRLALGNITIDPASRSFSLPMRVIRHELQDVPMEFLIMEDGGFKDYETFFTVSVSANQFNLACLLIGLDPKNAILPKGNFDPTPASGDPVALWVELPDESAPARPIGTFLALGDGADASEDWVYTGSYFMPGGQYAAAELKNLVGFSHDLESIIQHGPGLGIADGYGSVIPGGRTEGLPDIVRLRVEALAK